MPETTLQEKRLSLETHHFQLLLLQWLWEHLFLKGTVPEMYTTIILSSLPTSRCWIFLCYQLPTTFHFSKRQQKGKKQPQQPPNPKAPQSSFPGSKMTGSNTDFCNSVREAVIFWSSLSQQPQKAIINCLGYLFHLHTEQHNFLHFQGITKPSLVLLRNCERS